MGKPRIGTQHAGHEANEQNQDDNSPVRELRQPRPEWVGPRAANPQATDPQTSHESPGLGVLSHGFRKPYRIKGGRPDRPGSCAGGRLRGGAVCDEVEGRHHTAAPWVPSPALPHDPARAALHSFSLLSARRDLHHRAAVGVGRLQQPARLFGGWGRPGGGDGASAPRAAGPRRWPAPAARPWPWHAGAPACQQSRLETLRRRSPHKQASPPAKARALERCQQRPSTAPKGRPRALTTNMTWLQAVSSSPSLADIRLRTSSKLPTFFWGGGGGGGKAGGVIGLPKPQAPRRAGPSRARRRAQPPKPQTAPHPSQRSP